MEYYNRHEIYFIVVLSLHAIHKNSPPKGAEREEILEKRNDKNLLNYTPGEAQNYFIHIYYRALMHNFAYFASAMSDCEI